MRNLGGKIRACGAALTSTSSLNCAKRSAIRFLDKDGTTTLMAGSVIS